MHTYYVATISFSKPKTRQNAIFFRQMSIALLILIFEHIVDMVETPCVCYWRWRIVIKFPDCEELIERCLVLQID